jgi:RNA polymerase sigma factor (sigma-70 family)
MFCLQMPLFSSLHNPGRNILIIFQVALNTNKKGLSFLKDIIHSQSSDHELVHQYKQEGDVRVLGELYQRYMDLVFAVCMKYLKDPAAAQDAVMAIFEELVSKLRKHEVTHFKGWLYTVARNYCLMELRSNKQMPVTQIPDFMQFSENSHLDDAVQKELNLNRLLKCIEGLSPDQKQTVQLFYLEEKSYKEIAGLTQTEWNKVRSLVQNASRNLKICMDKNGPSDD